MLSRRRLARGRAFRSELLALDADLWRLDAFMAAGLSHCGCCVRVSLWLVNHLPCSGGFADVSKFHVTAAATGPKSCDCLPNPTLEGQHSLRPYLNTSLPVELSLGQLPSPP
jgi:hypothetical protein